MQVETYFKAKTMRLNKYHLDKLYIQVWQRDGCQCQNPRCPGGFPIDSAPHHIKFRSQGGSDTKQNLITMCIECHGMIHRSGFLKLYRLDTGLEWQYFKLDNEGRVVCDDIIRIEGE